jgi:hypothetical protein
LPDALAGTRVLTAHDDPQPVEALAEVLELQCRGDSRPHVLLRKPFEIHELEFAVEQVLADHQTRRLRSTRLSSMPREPRTVQCDRRKP